MSALQRIPRPVHVLLPAIVLLVDGSLVLEVMRRTRPPRPSVELRNELLHARAAADSCAAALAAEEERFRAYNARVDSMRQAVRGFEALDPGGVPADSYAHYLAAFDSYNTAAAAWQARADSLRANWALCREATELYNTLADSVRGMIE